MPGSSWGYRYHSRALDTSSQGLVLEDPATSPALPGSMAHHVLITLDNDDSTHEPRPIADLLGQTFVLILASSAASWCRASETLSSGSAKHLPPVRVHRLEKETDSAFCAKYAISTSGAVLIRPDGFVAWSASEDAVLGFGAMGVPEPSKTLLAVMERILCLNPSAPSSLPASTVLTSPSALLPKLPPTQVTLSTALFMRERMLEAQKSKLQQQVEQIDAQLADVRRLGALQDETAMLSMKVLPVQETPPEYSFEDCVGRKMHSCGR